MVAELAMLAVLILASSAELWHARRARRIAILAFGAKGRPTVLGAVAPWLSVAALAAATWGLTTLLILPPKVHGGLDLEEKDRRHLVVVLDVSPSMRLRDGGPSGEQSRTQRVADLMRSLFARVPMQQFRVSVVAVYNGAKPVVVDTTDPEVVWNIFDDLPMQYAFPTGKTRLFDGLEEAAKIAKGWDPGSASLLFLSDGDTVPATNTPQLPPSISDVLVVGVGDPKSGRFIDGRQSRQDVSTLRQIALRLQGEYHNGNEKQLPTEMVELLVPRGHEGPFDKLTKREYALLATGAGTFLYAIVPLLLHYMGTRWSPGVRTKSPSRRPWRKRDRNTTDSARDRRTFTATAPRLGSRQRTSPARAK